MYSFVSVCLAVDRCVRIPVLLAYKRRKEKIVQVASDSAGTQGKHCQRNYSSVRNYGAAYYQTILGSVDFIFWIERWGGGFFWGYHIIIGRSSSRLPSKTEFGKGSSIQLFLAET